MPKYLSNKFKELGPVLPDVKIVEVWGFYDCPLYGVCEVEGERFFFQDVAEIWRRYSEKDTDRLWTIYVVYDIHIEDVKQLQRGKPRFDWSEDIEEISDPIGVFWEYELVKE